MQDLQLCTCIRLDLAVPEGDICIWVWVSGGGFSAQSGLPSELAAHFPGAENSNSLLSTILRIYRPTVFQDVLPSHRNLRLLTQLYLQACTMQQTSNYLWRDILAAGTQECGRTVCCKYPVS